MAEIDVQLLECGTSLAENEYMSTSTQKDEKPEKEHHEPEKIQSIDSLRSMIALDLQLPDFQGNSCLTTFSSPFEIPKAANATNRRYFTLPLIYCDQTASNRAVASIEKYMSSICLPMYGNTHTNTSITGSQSTAFVAEARQIVAEQTNAKITGKASLDIVLFAGNGATSSVELLIDCLGLKHYDRNDNNNRPVVFIGPYEHHSNLIPWRESGCEIVMIPETNGTVDLEYLKHVLPKYSQRPLKMGTFTAASNVTGKVCNVQAIARVLHQHNALCFIDYATAAPYLKIDMNPVQTDAALDAVFISPHKMLGGVGTPGILIVKKTLVSQVNAPARGGGGTVFYVTNQHHRFLSNRIERYEGGTPNVAGIIRTGLVFLLKRQIEQKYQLLQQQLTTSSESSIPPTLQDYEYSTYREVAAYLKEHAPNLVLLGEETTRDNNNSQNLPIFSFLIRFGQRFLHYNYVCAVLNDVFGIQSRGGCQCAGPYSQRLLGLTSTDDGTEVPNLRNEEIEDALIKYKERAELLRPGYTRLSLPFKGLTTEEVDYVKKALVWVSKNGWALMCQYRCNHRTGEWRHSNRQGKPLGKGERRWLSHYSFGSSSDQSLPHSSRENLISDDRTSILKETLSNADTILVHAKTDHRSIVEALKMVDADLVLGQDEDAKLEELRWYVYPKECATFLSKGVSADSNGSISLLGAIRPSTMEQTTSSDERMGIDATTVDDSSTTSSDRKRKSEDPDPNQSAKDEGCMIVAPSTMLLFRDGDYTGEAPFEEIESGIDDGELSEKCQIFDRTTDSWVDFQKVSLDVKKMKSNFEKTAAEKSGTFANVAVEAKKEKKATRDSTTWGQATLLAPNSNAAKEATIPMEVDSIIKPEQPQLVKKNKKFKHIQPPAKIMKLATQAVMQWEMIKEGDKLLLGLSGGKDSLTLLHCLLEFQRKLPFKFEIEVCTIDPMTPSFDPSPLIPYVESLGLKYHYIRDNIVERANNSGKEGKIVSSLCAFCARMKRGNLYTCARRNNCNKLVLAQHLDDCAESFMMSVMHNGFLRTMKAHYAIDAGDLSVIRPLIYCRESLMTDFAKSVKLPVINENCPACFEEPKERARVKKMLSREETLHPNFYDNIKRSLIPLMHDDLSPILRSYTEEVVSRSRRNPKQTKGEKSSQKKASTPNLYHAAGSSEEKTTTKESSTVLKDFSEEELIIELARRRAEKARTSGNESTKHNDDTGIVDPTGQVCTLNGGNGSIPCRELME